MLHQAKHANIYEQINDTKSAEFSYTQIQTNYSLVICHLEAIRAALSLCILYERERNYNAARKVYNSLWQIFIKHGKDYELKPSFAEELYNKYVLVSKASKVEYVTIRQIAIDYRKACV